MGRRRRPADPAGPLTVDLDSTICEVYGRGKQGAAFGYTKVRGYHPQLATLAETGQVIFSRLRGGSAGAARGAKSFLTETISRLRDAGATGALTVRADSAFYSRAVLATARKLGVRFSITARQDRKIRAAIESIPEQAWTPIPYWLSTPEVSGADVAEVPYTAFAGTRDAIEVRLVVRRVRPTPGSQLALFTTWSYHAMVTDRPGELLNIEADHRRHAVVEQIIAELKSAGLAHLPSGKFMANAAWLALAVHHGHNLGRAIGALAGMARANAATLRQRLFTVPGRLVHTARRLHLRLPDNWPWARAFNTAVTHRGQRVRRVRFVPSGRQRWPRAVGAAGHRAGRRPDRRASQLSRHHAVRRVRPARPARSVADYSSSPTTPASPLQASRSRSRSGASSAGPARRRSAGR